MKTKLFTFFLALLASSGTAFSAGTLIGDLYYSLNFANKTAAVSYQILELTNYEELTTIKIPTLVTYDEISFRVTSIGERAFYGCSGLTSIEIPNSVTSIGNMAFEKCTGLTSVVVESGNPMYDSRDNCNAIIETASNTLIQGCQNTIIPNSVTSIGDYAFYQCRGLTSMVIPNSVASIGKQAFYGCTGLTSIEIPNSVISIGEWAFYNCTGLTSVTIGNSVTSIGGGAFGGCSGLTSIEIPNSVTSIGEQAFYGCTGLTSLIVENGNSVYDSRNDCNAIIETATNTLIQGCQNTIIPNSVTSIWSSAFFGCSSLTSIEIPNSVISIGEWAFYGCTGLTSVTIPNSVTSIGIAAFSLIQNIIYYGEATGGPWGAKCINGYVDGWLVYSDESRTHLIGCSTAATGEIFISNTVASIGKQAFYGCTGLTSIEIPNSVTSIGEWAFYNCTGLTSVTIPNSVTSIGNMAFENCTSLTSVEIPSSVTSIGGAAFAGCTGLTSVTIPNSVTSIGFQAFSGCSGLTSVTIPNSVTSIGADAFFGCSSLTSVTINSNPIVSKTYAYNYNLKSIFGEQVTKYIIGDNVTSIGFQAFSGCSGLTSVTIGNSVTSIGDKAFYGCSSLTSITIPNSVTSIGDNAFYQCSGLTSVTIGNSVTSIGESAFLGCSSLTSITIPNSVTSIGDNAFYKCIGLTSVTIGNSVTSIGEGAFGSCTGLTSVTIPNSVTSIGKHAFSGCTSLTSIEIPPSVTSIEEHAFFRCNLTSVKVYDIVTWCNISFFDDWSNPLFCARHLYLNSEEVRDLVIPRSVTSIGNRAFRGYSGFKSITIGDSVVSIGNSAFRGCYGITNITFPESIISIGDSAFFSISTLTEVKMLSKTPPTLGTFVFDGSKSLDIYVPCGSLEAYKSAWSHYKSQIKLPDLEYAINASINMVDAGNVNVPQNTCEELSAVANYGYHFVQWSDGNTDNPRTIELTQDTTLTAEFAYDRSGNCGNDSLLTWEYNPDEKTLYIDGNGAFVENILCGVEARPNLEKVIIGKNITAINSTAFTNCPNLTTVEWNAINSGDCTACPFPSTVTSISFGDDIEHIPANLCNGLTGISSIVIPSSVTTIGDYAFANINNRKISNLVLPSEIISIGDYAFAGNTYIEQIDFGKSLESIGAYAFQNCSRVMTMTCLAEVTPDVGTNALASISSNADLYVLNSALKKYQVDANWSRFLLKPLGATGTETGGEVVVIPGDNTATFTWPTTDEAGSYTIQITKDGELICTLIFNANGQLSGIAFAAGRDHQSKTPAATLSGNGMQFTVTGLNSASKYGYRLSAANEENRELVSYAGEFATTGYSGEVNPGGEPEYNTEDFDNVDILDSPQKIIRDGQVLILRGDKTYTLTGQEVK